MHVCVVCHEASLTGAPRIGFDIALSLTSNHDVTLLSKGPGELIELPHYAPLRPSYRVLNTSHVVCNMTYRERVAHAIDLLRELRPDMLYVNSVCSGEWCEAGARATIPVVLHTHETRGTLPALLSNVCTPRILTWTDFLVGASRRALDDLEELTSTSVGNGNRLDIGIFIDTTTVLALRDADVKEPVNARNHARDYRMERPAVAMCGVAQRRKGSDIFFDLATQLPQYDFIWIGPWSPSETHENKPTFERFMSLALDNFYVTGLTTNPYAHLSRADTFLLTSREDPNPLVVAEALVLGRKVIAFAETGSSVAMLETHGYAFSGSPSVDRLKSLLPKVVDGDASWRTQMSERVRAEVDGAQKLATLTRVLEQFADHAIHNNG